MLFLTPKDTPASRHEAEFLERQGTVAQRGFSRQLAHTKIDWTRPALDVFLELYTSNKRAKTILRMSAVMRVLLLAPAH